MGVSTEQTYVLSGSTQYTSGMDAEPRARIIAAQTGSAVTDAGEMELEVVLPASQVTSLKWGAHDTDIKADVKAS